MVTRRSRAGASNRAEYDFNAGMSIDSLPQELGAAHDMVRRLSEALAARELEVERLAGIVKKLQRMQFGKSAEKLDPDQLRLALDDVEMALAAAEAEGGQATSAPRAQRGPAKRGDLPAHLPRVEVVVDIEDKSCPCCGAAMHGSARTAPRGASVSSRPFLAPS